MSGCPASTMQATPSRLALRELLGHQIDVAHRVGARRAAGGAARRLALDAAAGRCAAQHRGGGRAERSPKSGAERHVLVEQRRAARRAPRARSP